MLPLCYKQNNDGISSKAGAFVCILQGSQITLSNCCVMTTAAVFLIKTCVSWTLTKHTQSILPEIRRFDIAAFSSQ